MATKAAKVSGKQVLAEMERYINHMVANHRKPESITLTEDQFNAVAIYLNGRKTYRGIPVKPQ